MDGTTIIAGVGMQSFIIRLGTVADLEGLVVLEQAAFPADAFHRDQLLYLLKRAHATFFVLEESGQVRGSAVILWRAGSQVARLYSLVVDPAFQGGGLGTELLKACEQAVRERGCRRMSLEVRVENRQAGGFYQQRGYRIAAELPGYYHDGANGLRLVKEL